METIGNLVPDHNAQNRRITGMFSDREALKRAYKELHDRGYTNDEISLMMSDETRKQYFSEHGRGMELEDQAQSEIGKKTAIGGTIGALAGIGAALAAGLLLPGIGILVAGPLVIALAGAGAGGVTGSIIGALVGSGIAEDHAKSYESGIKKGNIVMSVHPKNEEDANYIERTWHENKVEDIHK